MPDPFSQLSMFAEEAIGDIRLIVHEYSKSRTVSPGVKTDGRFEGPGVRFGNRATQFAVANLVSIVEFYAEQILLDRGCDSKKIRTWVDKHDAWLKAFGADIQNPNVCPSFEPMRGYYEARNAIMHRRGELTHSQRKKDVYTRLTAADIDRIGYDVVVTENTVHACAKVCMDCVRELDKTVTP